MPKTGGGGGGGGSSGGGGGGKVVAEDVTIEIPAWDDFYGFSTNQNPQSMNYGGFGWGNGNPSPIDASLYAGYNPLAQSFDQFLGAGWGYNGMQGYPFMMLE